MKSFNFSKKFEQVTSLVLAIMLLLSVFTASNVAVFADSNNKSTKTKNSDSEVNLYVKSDVQPFIKSSSDSEYKIISKTNAEDDYYSAKVKKSSSASTADTANITYRLANFSVDNNKVYFIKPSDWIFNEPSKLKAYFWNNNSSENINMAEVTDFSNLYVCDSENNIKKIESYIGNDEKLYFCDIPEGMTNVIFYYWNYYKQTVELDLNNNNLFKTKNEDKIDKKKYGANSIGSVGDSFTEIKQNYSFTEPTLIDISSSDAKLLKMSDVKLKVGKTDLSFENVNDFNISDDELIVDNINGFDAKIYYDNKEIKRISDIEKYDETLTVTVMVSGIPEMSKDYKIKVNSGLTLVNSTWKFNDIQVSGDGSEYYVYSPKSKEELEVTPKMIPTLKYNGNSVESDNIKYYIDQDEIDSIVFSNPQNDGFAEKELAYEIAYNNSTVKGTIKVKCYFVNVALSSFVDETSKDKTSLVDEAKQIIYQKGKSSKYEVYFDKNIEIEKINYSIDNGANVDFASDSNSDSKLLTVSNLTGVSKVTIKYPTEDGFEVKTYTIIPDNNAPEIESITFVEDENTKFNNEKSNPGLYSSNTINFKIKLNDSIAGVDEKSLLSSDIFLYDSFDSENNIYKCSLNINNTIDSKTEFNISDKVNNKATLNLKDLINSGKVYVGEIQVRYELFKVVFNTENKLKVKNEILGSRYNDTNNNIRSGEETTVIVGIDESEEPSYFNNISGLNYSYNGKDEKTVQFNNSQNDPKKFTCTIPTEKTGEYEFSYTVTNNSGVKKDVSETFYVDNTAPEVTKVEFNKKDENSIVKILNFLTFGIYSNDTIVMKVTATDSAPTSGLPNDTIKVKNGETEIKAIAPTDIAASNATQDSKVTYSFELGNSAQANSAQAYDLSFTVKDNAQNTLTKTLKELIKDGNTEFNKPESLGELNSDVFEVVSSTKEPTVKISYEAKGTDAFNASNKNIYHGDTLTVTMDLENNISGLQTMSDLSVGNFDNTNLSNFKLTKVNDEDQSTTVNTFGELVKNFENIAKKEKVTSATVMFDINISRNSEYSGEHTVKLKVTDNSGNSNSEISNSTFYVDNTAPKIDSVKFEYNHNPFEKMLNLLTFGIYSNDTIVMNVTASDSAPTSGFDNLTNAIKVVDANGNEISVTKVEKAASNATQESKVTYSFEIGNSAQAYNLSFMVKDNAGNTTDNITLTSIKNKNLGNDKYYEVFVENKDSHNLNEHINIDLPQTSVKDSNGKNLYKNDVNVNLTINDVYSGIARIDYTVKSDFDKNNEQQGTININDESKGSSVEDNNGVSWNINEKQNTRVTQASSTITVKNNSNNIKISVKLTDRAGNVSTKEQTLSIDKTNPTIKIEYDNNNHTSHNDTEFFKANRTATITVTERNFNPEDIDYKITNTDNVIPQISDWTKHAVTAGENPDGDTYTATIVYAADGDYTFDIAFTDMAGNKADKVAQHKFTVDKTIPTINVSFDNNSAKNNNYYKADRTATITVNEHNFNAQDVKVNISATGADNSTAATAPSVSSWTSNGNIHTATVKFANDGKYAFDVNYTDLADNAAKENVVTTFYVDKTAPTVKISNVVNESANSGNVAPVISLSDNNYSGDYVFSLTRVDINAKKTDVTNDFASTVVPTNNIGAVVTYANFASEEVNDGIYVLNATLTDKAGNSSADTITFSVNRFGSTYMGGDEETNALLDNGYTNAEKDIVISEINVDKLTKSNISLSLDSSSLKTLKQNVDYTIQEDAKTGQWHRYNYTVKSSNFENEGNYTLELSSTDAAKNTSTNRIRPVEKRKLAVQFVVDKTSPVVNIAGIENNALYEENSKDVTIVCEDSYINPSSLVINLDNKTLKEGKDYTVEKDVASITAKIKVNATSDISSQNIKVSVKDMAQNSGDGSVENFTLSATVLMRFFANPVLVIISAVILAGIIVMVVLIVAKKRKNN